VPMVRPVKECPESLHRSHPLSDQQAEGARRVERANGRGAAHVTRPLWETSNARGSLIPYRPKRCQGDIFPAVGTPAFETSTRRSLEAAIACHVNHPRRRHAPTYVGAGPVLRGGRKPISRAAWADAGRPWRVGPPRSGAL
jgi:hypothetical protein